MLQGVDGVYMSGLVWGLENCMILNKSVQICQPSKVINIMGTDSSISQPSTPIR